MVQGGIAIFVGGVQDFTTMVASIRNRGDSLAQIGKRAMGPLTYRLFLLFILLAVYLPLFGMYGDVAS